jgi:Domain of unknown function (DUF4136)
MPHKIHRRTAKLGFGLVLTLVACNVVLAQDVTTNSMPGTNFSQFHTYKWVAIRGATYPNQILDQEIKDAINTQLSQKGLTMTTGEKADLYVGYQTAVDQQKQWNAYGMGGGWRFGGGMGTATSSTIDIGTIVVDMYDPSTKQLVWTGRATKTLNPSKNQQKNMENLNKAMQKLLKNYPPQS